MLKDTEKKLHDRGKKVNHRWNVYFLTRAPRYKNFTRTITTINTFLFIFSMLLNFLSL